LRTTYNGAVKGSYKSLAFGDGTMTTGADNDPYHFAELDYDYPSSTDHAQFRQYSPTQGRWLSPDPYYGSYDSSNPQSMNRYAYVLNSPLSLIDQAGLCAGMYVTISWQYTTIDGVYVPGSFIPSYSAPYTMDNGMPCVFQPGCQPRTNADGTESTGIVCGAVVQVTANSSSGSSAPSSGSLADLARCASKGANSVSAAALLPQGTPSIISNLLGNDFSTISDLITGPGRMDAAGGILQGKAFNAGVQAVGGIQYTADRFILGTNGAGTSYAIDMIGGTIAESALGKAAGAVLGGLSNVKLGYDALTYAGAALVCHASQTY
jgi:RHS repeat-associated protein